MLCFRPLTGISLFLLCKQNDVPYALVLFSSPHGDFSFSIPRYRCPMSFGLFSSPHGDFSFSIEQTMRMSDSSDWVFVPSRGFLFFYFLCKIILIIVLCVFVPSRGFLFFYSGEITLTVRKNCFRPLTGISLFLL